MDSGADDSTGAAAAAPMWISGWRNASVDVPTNYTVIRRGTYDQEEYGTCVWVLGVGDPPRSPGFMWAVQYLGRPYTYEFLPGDDHPPAHALMTEEDTAWHAFGYDRSLALVMAALAMDNTEPPSPQK